MAYSYYIYYRVAPHHAETCEARVHELLAAIQQITTVTGRLLKKRNEPLLWMEVYENVGDDTKFELELAHAATRLKLAECLQDGSARRSECFEA